MRSVKPRCGCRVQLQHTLSSRFCWVCAGIAVPGLVNNACVCDASVRICPGQLLLHFTKSPGSTQTPPFAAMGCAQDAVASQLLTKCADPKHSLRCTRIAQPQKCVSRRAAAQLCKRRILQCCAQAQTISPDVVEATVLPEADTKGMSAWLDGLKWDAGGLVAVIAQVRPATTVKHNI